MLRHLLRECVSRAPMTTPRALAPWTACVAGCAAARASPSARMRPWMGTAQIRPWVGTASRAASTSPVTAASPSSRYGARRGRGRVALLRPRAATTTGPNPSTTSPSSDDDDAVDDASRGWTLLGCDSGAGGALAVVRGPSLGHVASVDVHDCPTYKAEVNGRARKRLCVEDMVELVASLDIPRGTVAFVEEGGVEYGFSAQTAFVQGYNFGLWKGVLAAAGLRVEVVKPQAWKHALGLARSGSSKDDSRDMASAMFPEVGDNLGRKKDHGRAEALLIAAYGHMATHARDARAAAASAAALGRSDAAEEDPLCRRVRDMVTRAAEEAASSETSDDDDETTRSGLRKRLGPDDPLPYFGPYFGMTGKALGEECRRRGLRVSGKKMELIERLEEDDAAAMRRAREAAAVMEAKGDEEEEEEEEEERGARRAAAA